MGSFSISQGKGPASATCIQYAGSSAGKPFVAVGIRKGDDDVTLFLADLAEALDTADEIRRAVLAAIKATPPGELQASRPPSALAGHPALAMYFEDGKAAARLGKGAETCPLPTSSYGGMEWLRGWDEVCATPTVPFMQMSGRADRITPEAPVCDHTYIDQPEGGAKCEKCGTTTPF